MVDTRNVVDPNLPVAQEQYSRQWQDQLLRVLRLYFATVNNAVNAAIKTPKDRLELTDGVTAPDAAEGRALIYVDSADGELKIKLSDGTIKLIITNEI